MRTLPRAASAPRVVVYALCIVAVLTVLVALLMSAPGEYRMMQLAQFHTPWAYGGPVVISVYAVTAVALTALDAWIEQTISRTALLASGGASLVAMAVQTVAHCIEAGYIPAHSVYLVVAVSAIPTCAAVHVIHLAMHVVMRTMHADALRDVVVPFPTQRASAHAMIVPVPDALSLVPGVPESTLRSWLQRGQLTKHADPAGGRRVLVDVEEIRARLALVP